MVKKIYSQNADFQKFQVLKTNRNKRYKYGEFFVEGVRNINGAVQGGWEIRSFLYTREKDFGTEFVACFGPDKADVIYDCAGNT